MSYRCTSLTVRGLKRTAAEEPESYDLSSETHIYGPNAAGKTRIRDALVIGLLGYHPTAGRGGTPARQERDIMKLASGDSMHVGLAFEGDGLPRIQLSRTFSRSWKAGKASYPRQSVLFSRAGERPLSGREAEIEIRRTFGDSSFFDASTITGATVSDSERRTIFYRFVSGEWTPEALAQEIGRQNVAVDDLRAIWAELRCRMRAGDDVPQQAHQPAALRLWQATDGPLSGWLKLQHELLRELSLQAGRELQALRKALGVEQEGQVDPRQVAELEQAKLEAAAALQQTRDIWRDRETEARQAVDAEQERRQQMQSTRAALESAQAALRQLEQRQPEAEIAEQEGRVSRLDNPELENSIPWMERRIEQRERGLLELSSRLQEAGRMLDRARSDKQDADRQAKDFASRCQQAEQREQEALRPLDHARLLATGRAQELRDVAQKHDSCPVCRRGIRGNQSGTFSIDMREATDTRDYQLVLTITVDGEEHEYRDGGEPEDQTFGRDWAWVEGEIERAYLAGLRHGASETDLRPVIDRLVAQEVAAVEAYQLASAAALQRLEKYRSRADRSRQEAEQAAAEVTRLEGEHSRAADEHAAELLAISSLRKLLDEARRLRTSIEARIAALRSGELAELLHDKAAAVDDLQSRLQELARFVDLDELQSRLAAEQELGRLAIEEAQARLQQAEDAWVAGQRRLERRQQLAQLELRVIEQETRAELAKRAAQAFGPKGLQGVLLGGDVDSFLEASNRAIGPLGFGRLAIRMRDDQQREVFQLVLQHQDGSSSYEETSSGAESIVIPIGLLAGLHAYGRAPYRVLLLDEVQSLDRARREQVYRAVRGMLAAGELDQAFYFGCPDVEPQLPDSARLIRIGGEP